MADFYTLRREKVVILWETFFPFEPIHYYLAIDIWSYNRYIMRLEIAISPWKSYKLVFELFPQASNSFSLQIFLYQMAWNFLNQNCSTTGFKTMSIFWSHKKIMDYHFQTAALSFLKTLRQQGKDYDYPSNYCYIKTQLQNGRLASMYYCCHSLIVISFLLYFEIGAGWKK